MNVKMTLLALLMTIISGFAIADTSHYHKLASVVLNDENANYMVRSTGNEVYVVTFDYKTPAETCKFLQNKGVLVIRVTNYTKDVPTSKNC